MSGARGDYIPTVLQASTLDGLRPLYFIANHITGKVNTYEIKQDNKKPFVWYAIFYAHPEEAAEINRTISEMENNDAN